MQQELVFVVVLLWLALQVPLGSLVGDFIRLGGA